MNNEQLLIKQIKNGNHKAYKTLFNQYFKILTLFAKKYVNDIDIAQDITQEVFVQLYEKREILSIHTSFKAYFYTVIKNRCLDYIKIHKIHLKHKTAIKNQNLIEFIDDTDFIEQTELQEKIYKAINSLPYQNQRIFKLSRFSELSNQEIANKLNISKRTVETHISNALKKLRSTILSWLLVFL